MKRREAQAEGLETYNTGKPCKHGHRSDRRTSDGACLRCYADQGRRQKIRRKANPGIDSAAAKARYHTDLETSRANHRKWAKTRRDADPEAARAYQRQWRRENRNRANGYAAYERARQLGATPSWLTPAQKEEMIQFYIACPKGWHVDHILPLDGPEVCGLHVPWNLQYLPARANRLKGRRLNPQLWPAQAQLGPPPKLSGAMIAHLNRRYRVVKE